MKEEWVKAHYHDIIKTTEKAVLFLFEEREVWIPNKLFRFMEGKNIRIPNFIAIEKNIKANKIECHHHQPKHIEPVFNQQPINELVYEKIS